MTSNELEHLVKRTLCAVNTYQRGSILVRFVGHFRDTRLSKIGNIGNVLKDIRSAFKTN